MDAYDLSEKIKKLRGECVSELPEQQTRVCVCVHTDQGYKEINDVKINRLGFIELVVDD